LKSQIAKVILEHIVRFVWWKFLFLFVYSVELGYQNIGFCMYNGVIVIIMRWDSGYNR
jgi:hypothetical protein